MTGKTETQTARVPRAIGIPITNLKEPLSFGDEARSHNQSRPQNSRSRLGLLLLLLALIGATQTASAQLSIPVVRGDNGLKSGSQAPSGIYLTGLVYFYDTHEIIDKDGNRFNRVSIEQAFAAVALTYVSKRKFLGGTYAATVVLPIANVAIDTPQSAS